MLEAEAAVDVIVGPLVQLLMVEALEKVVLQLELLQLAQQIQAEAAVQQTAALAEVLEEVEL
jgi:hypothetical protein